MNVDQFEPLEFPDIGQNVDSTSWPMSHVGSKLVVLGAQNESVEMVEMEEAMEFGNLLLPTTVSKLRSVQA